MLTIYTTTTCAYCAMVKKLFDAKGVKYQAVNLDEQPEKREEAFKLTDGLQTVPITTNGTDFVVGFVPAKLMGLLS